MGCYSRKSVKAGPFRLNVRRLGMAACLAAGLLGSRLAGAPALAQSATPCHFALGFAALHDRIPDQVGDCVDDEAHNPTNGDAVQHTTRGLLVWRKADNWTAFTDGYRTWVNGPNGVQERLNTQRFAWEANPTGLPVVGAAGAAPTAASPTPTSAPPTPGANGTVITTQVGQTVTVASQAGHTFYASTYRQANSIYCDTDPGWQSLSKKYLVSYPSLPAALAALPGYHLHRPC